MGDTTTYRTMTCERCGKVETGNFGGRRTKCDKCKAKYQSEYHRKYRAEKAEKIREINRAIAAEKKEKGWCQACKKGVPVVPGSTMCQKHLDARKKASKARFNRNEAEGVCRMCGRERKKGTKHCLKCLGRASARARVKSEEMKGRIIEVLGGRCQDCGLVSEVPTVYDIHHLNPETKDWKWKHFKTYSWDRIQEEIAKGVVLLCANCHRIRHYRDPNNQANWGD